MKSLHAYTAEFIEAITAAGAPPSIAMQCECYLVRALMKAERQRQAAALLPKLGPNATAERLGVCKATVYNDAKRARSPVAA
jgi:hypothetical protein